MTVNGDAVPEELFDWCDAVKRQVHGCKLTCMRRAVKTGCHSLSGQLLASLQY